jgi:hypothetical protein
MMLLLACALALLCCTAARALLMRPLGLLLLPCC